MDLSRTSPTPARYTGIGVVVALHLAAVYALSAGLMKSPAPPKEPSILLPKLPDKPVEPDLLPQPLVKAERPTFPTVPVQDIVPPREWTDAPTITTEPARADAAPAGAPTGSAPGPAVAAPVSEPALRSPGAVCSVMPRPEVPSVNWSGEAVLQAVATVRGGHVVSSEVRVAQGAVDARTRRALQRSVEAALSAYQCQGDAVFQQDFAFRLD